MFKIVTDLIVYVQNFIIEKLCYNLFLWKILPVQCLIPLVDQHWVRISLPTKSSFLPPIQSWAAENSLKYKFIKIAKYTCFLKATPPTLSPPPKKKKYLFSC